MGQGTISINIALYEFILYNRIQEILLYINIVIM